MRFIIKETDVKFEPHRRRWWVSALVALLVLSGVAVGSASASSGTKAPLPGFRDGYAVSDGIRIHYVVGGHGPAVVLLHGWPATWYSWAKIAPSLAARHTVIMPDLRGLGQSGFPAKDAGNYTGPAMADDLRAVVHHLGFRHVDLVAHDMGGLPAVAFAARYRTEVGKLVMMEAPVTHTFDALLWQRPDLFWFAWLQQVTKDSLPERLIAGREGIYYPGSTATSPPTRTPSAPTR
jgi:pimeloyl-ACP methyl ester carboxylesterase